MAKRKHQTTKESNTYFVGVHSKGCPQILAAVCKDTTQDRAVEVSRKLWALADEPYLARITDAALQEVFFHKDSKKSI